MTETTIRAPKTLAAVFVVHGLITLAGAIVLTVFPTAIPSAVGIHLERPEYLLAYLVGATELAVAVLSAVTTRRAPAGSAPSAHTPGNRPVPQ